MAIKKAKPVDEKDVIEVDPQSNGLVRLVRDAVDESGVARVGPLTADVHESEVQGYIDANVGWQYAE